MHRLKELISDLFEIEQDCLHNIEIQDIEFAPSAEQEIGRNVGEMASSMNFPADIPDMRAKPRGDVRCRGFWIETTRDLVLYLWHGHQSRTILLGKDSWTLRDDITIH